MKMNIWPALERTQQAHYAGSQTRTLRYQSQLSNFQLCNSVHWEMAGEEMQRRLNISVEL